MINITSEMHFPTDLMDTILRTAVANAIGVSAGAYGTILHLPDNANTQQQADAQAILTHVGNLTVNADKTAMTEGDDDPIITVSSSDAELGYYVLVDGEEYDSGMVAVVSGTATLNLVSPIAGVYQIYVYRTVNNFSSGSITVTVNEV